LLNSNGLINISFTGLRLDFAEANSELYIGVQVTSRVLLEEICKGVREAEEGKWKG
jgi:hypothetical protein